MTAQSLPGEEFLGEIVFVDPVVDKDTRTIKLRVNVANPNRRLKPEMFVTAEIKVAVGEGATAAAPKAGGPFACPMHPWEHAEEQGRCPICEMKMVNVESIPGYSPASQPVKLLSVLREAIREALHTLTERERLVLTRRFALDGGGESTFRQIADEVGLTSERVRQIQIEALRKLRHPTRRKFFAGHE